MNVRYLIRDIENDIARLENTQNAIKRLPCLTDLVIAGINIQDIPLNSGMTFRSIILLQLEALEAIQKARLQKNREIVKMADALVAGLQSGGTNSEPEYLGAYWQPSGCRTSYSRT